VRGLAARAARSVLRACARSAGHTRVGRAFCDQLFEESFARSLGVTHQGTQLRFAVPNRLSLERVRTFATKEPETLEWIDTLAPGSVLWDVGANVGLYSCYAAKARRCRVFAFEPSVFNLELLARNVFLNSLGELVTIIPLPLCAGLAQSELNLTTTAWGGALATFGSLQAHDGSRLRPVFTFRTVGVAADEAVARLAVPAPDHMKIDVDGIEPLVLQGAADLLERVISVSVEVNDACAEQAQQCERLLRSAGLRLVRKAHSAMIAANPSFAQTFNQTWAR
jgi:FkbM family methyltransferase